jgi:hypothetical protein
LEHRRLSRRVLVQLSQIVGVALNRFFLFSLLSPFRFVTLSLLTCLFLLALCPG